MQGEQPVDSRMRSILDDLLEERELLESSSSGHLNPELFLFDPQAYQRLHPELKLEDHQLSAEELQGWAVRVTTIRKGIKARA